MLSRRTFVGKLAASAAVACAAGVSAAQAKTSRENSHAPSRAGSGDSQLAPPPAPVTSEVSVPAPWELLRPLALGSVVSHGWSLAGLTGAADGSCVVTLRNERGRTHRVHVCRNDGRPQGMVYTRQFDLVVMNGGGGDLPTDEGLAQAVADVAHALAANEHGPQHEPVVTALLPHAKRVERFAAAAKLR